MRGRFHLWTPGEIPIILPNVIVDQGEESFLKMMMRADVADVAAGGNFYIGLCGNVGVAPDAVLTDLSDEPGATGGYARQAITRDATGWPTIDQVNGMWRALSAAVNFTASGADFDTSITRAFLCNVASGSAGILYAISSRLATPKLIVDTETYTVRYEIFNDGS